MTTSLGSRCTAVRTQPMVTCQTLCCTPCGTAGVRSDDTRWFGAKCRYFCGKIDNIMPGKHAPAIERFWRYVLKVDDGCWEWTGSRNDSGYGQFKVVARAAPLRAHRFSWLLHFGQIPHGLLVCHHCDNPPCVRPDHLFLGSFLNNSTDKIRKGRARGGGWHGCRRVNPQKLKGKRKLSDADIVAVRSRRGESSRVIAKDYGVAHTTIVRLLNGTHWADMPESVYQPASAGVVSSAS